MKRSILSFLLLCLLLAACNKSDTGSIPVCVSDGVEAQETGDCTLVTDSPVTINPAPLPDSGSDTGTDTDTATGLPNESFTFETNITFINMTAEQEAKFEAALEVIKKVVATDEFRNQVLNHTYGGQKTFVDNDGKSNEQIYQSILDAAESLQPTKNNTMDMEVELYYEDNNVVGYTNTGTKRIWVNTKYFNTNPISAVANNLFHEWLHKLGYGHSYYYTTSRDYSVPYAVGDIIESLSRQFL